MTIYSKQIISKFVHGISSRLIFRKQMLFTTLMHSIDKNKEKQPKIPPKVCHLPSTTQGLPKNFDFQPTSYSAFNSRHRIFILSLTFMSYVCYHASRKPISVVKNELINCTSHGNDTSGIDTDENDNCTSWISKSSHFFQLTLQTKNLKDHLFLYTPKNWPENKLMAK